MTLITYNKRIQKALDFLIDKQKTRPEATTSELIDEAGMRFDLTPLDTLHLTELLIGNATMPLIKNTNNTLL